MIFYISSIKHNNKIALRVGWKISWWLWWWPFWEWGVLCMYGQRRFTV